MKIPYPPSSSAISKISLAIMLMLITLITVMAGVLYLRDARNRSSSDTSELIITTETVPILYPHEHKVDNSVFDLGHHTVTNKIITISKDTWITGFEFVLENAPQEVLHHAGIFILNKPNRICPNALYGEEVYPVSSETNTPIVFSESYGVFLAEGTQLGVEVMYHNPLPPFGAGEIYKNVSSAIVMNVQKSDPAIIKKPLEYYRIHLDDIPCPGAASKEAFTVPAETNNFVKTSDLNNALDPSSYTFSRSGTIAHTHVHLHPWEGGKKLDVFLNDKLVTSFIPVRTSSDPWDWNTPHQQTSIRVKSGDVLSISATYSNPNPVPIKGAMGMFGFYFLPDE